MTIPSGVLAIVAGKEGVVPPGLGLSRWTTPSLTTVTLPLPGGTGPPEWSKVGLPCVKVSDVGDVEVRGPLDWVDTSSVRPR